MRAIPPPTSRCWKGSSRCAAGPACISAAPMRRRCIISSPRSWTMPWTRRWRATPPGSRSSMTRTGWLTVIDNGRGIPVDPHPKFKDKSALEVIMTTLHAGGKFNSKVYETSGGLHGVGVSVVNALSEDLVVEVARGQQLYRQSYRRGKPTGKLEKLGKVNNRRGTSGALQARSADLRQDGRVLRAPVSSAWRAPRPISSAASKSAGPAIPPTSRTRRRRKRPFCIFPAASRTFSRSASKAGRASPMRSSPAR